MAGEDSSQLDFELLSKPEWFKEPSKSSLLVHVFNVQGLDKASSIEFLDEISKHIALPKKVQIAIVPSGEIVFDVLTLLPAAAQSKQLTRSLSRDQKRLHPPLVFLSTPSCLDGRELTDNQAQLVLEAAAALFRLVVGRNFLFEKVHEYEFKNGGNSIGLTSPVIDLQSMVDGPIYSDDTLRILGILLSKVDSEHWNPVVQKSIHFIFRSFEPPDRFVNYWIGLEILCGGSKSKIEAVAKRAFNLDKSAVRNELGLAKIERTRNLVFHRGENYSPSQVVMRYLYYLYVDVLYHQLTGESLGLCHVWRREVGIDFSGINNLMELEVQLRGRPQFQK